ncbi:hypothetical protein YN1HA_18610 [Sulfurisphaera ohwakuensis]
MLIIKKGTYQHVLVSFRFYERLVPHMFTVDEVLVSFRFYLAEFLVKEGVL